MKNLFKKAMDKLDQPPPKGNIQENNVQEVGATYASDERILEEDIKRLEKVYDLENDDSRAVEKVSIAIYSEVRTLNERLAVLQQTFGQVIEALFTQQTEAGKDDKEPVQPDTDKPQPGKVDDKGKPGK